MVFHRHGKTLPGAGGFTPSFLVVCFLVLSFLLTGCGTPNASDVREYLQNEFDTSVPDGFRVESVSELGCIKYVQNGVKGYRFTYQANVRALKDSTLSDTLSMPQLVLGLGDVKSLSFLKNLLFADKGDVMFLEGDVLLMKKDSGWASP